MAVEVTCLRNILCLLRRHLCSILTIRHTARTEISAGALVFGYPFVFAGRGFHLTLYEPIREVWIHDEAFAASRLSMMRIMARRTKAATVVA